MKLLVVGMRRSGTTIVFDALAEDGRVAYCYEPFSHAPERGSPGGGSGSRTEDYAATVRALRAEFIREHPDLAGPPEALEFNRGAPGHPHLEPQPELESPYLEYLTWLFARGPHTVVKSVRVHAKLPQILARIPDLHVLHVVREPTSVLWSHARIAPWSRPLRGGIFDRRRVRRALMSPDGFNYWRSARLHDEFVARQGAAAAGTPPLLLPAAVKTLRLWAMLFDMADHAAGTAAAGRYAILPLERFSAAPDDALRAICRWAGLGGDSGPTPEALAWARTHVRPARGAPEAFADLVQTTLDRAELPLARIRERIAEARIL